MNRFSIPRAIVWIALLSVGLSLVPLIDCSDFADDLTDQAAKVTVENSDHCDSVSLFLAAGKAFKEGRFEDAGFLYYAGQFRAGVDMEVFEPLGVGGNSPAALLGALKATLGPGINPVVMRDRDAFGRIATRLASWKPAFDPAYNPGWVYRVALTGPAREAAIKQCRERMLAFIQPLSQLLQDDEFYRSFKIVQDHNLRGLGALPQPPGDAPNQGAPVQVSEAEFTAAMDRLKQIEKARGIKSGLFPDRDDWKRSRKTSYKVLSDRVTYHEHDVAGADSATFTVLTGEVDYGKDVLHVYVKGHEIPGADPQTFKVLDGMYARDKSHIYSGNVVIHVENMDRFEVVNASGASSELGAYGVESQFLLETGLTLESVGLSSNNLPIMGQDWARDGKWYYHGPTRVESADYASFKVIDEFKARDKDHEYSGAFTKEEWANRRHTILKIR